MKFADKIQRAAELVSTKRSLVITSGAGMGVDSGLPDFRGDEGLWNYYPPLRHLNVGFSSMANPAWFEKDAELAWGFYGHRLELYRNTVPNEGFRILKRWGEERFGGQYFAFTSNVDGQFQKAGFAEDRVVECHGSIHHMQRTDAEGEIHRVPETQRLEVNMDTLRVDTDVTPLPTIDGAPARPNILMFSDCNWIGDRTNTQTDRFEEFLSTAEDTLVIEIGAGLAVPTIRMVGEQLKWSKDAPLIRINPRDSEGADLSLECTGLEALVAIQKVLDA